MLLGFEILQQYLHDAQCLAQKPPSPLDGGAGVDVQRVRWHGWQLNEHLDTWDGLCFSLSWEG